jgi:hypothetical protein
LQVALIDFKATAEGKEFFQKTRQIDFRPIDETIMRQIDPFTSVLVEKR